MEANVGKDDSPSLRSSASFIVVFLLLLAITCSQNFGSEAAELPADEISALKAIGRKLGKKDWDFGVNPCTGAGGWVTPNMDKSTMNNVSCDCSFANNTVCHVITLVLKSQDLAGVLPEELSKLPFLTDFDVSRNFLNGTIPTTWGSLPLTHLSLMVNRLSGHVPKELGNITTLKELNFEANRLEGTLPPELGNLTSLSRLVLNSNKFTGELPSSFAKLRNLNNIRIVGSNFTGKIPDIFQNWTQLEILMIMGTSMEGPLPSSMSSLLSLKELISELKVPSSTFPQLENLSRMKVLVLRNCSISGPIPLYIWSMKQLRTLDLSFNNLTGELPPLYGLPSPTIKDLFLSNNKLNGSVPAWTYDSQRDVDLSRNNFSGTIPSRVCSSGNVNMLSSFSTSNGNPQCVQKNFPCTSPRYSSLYIKCGGNSDTINGIRYETDVEHSGDATYFYNETAHWAFSSTGWALDFSDNIYIMSNQTRLLMNDSALYMTARTTSSTMTYYGLCLQDGNYNVKLHFAEIIFTDDQSFRSLGERIFDVYIQGRRVLTDFNIARESGGSGRELIKSFNASLLGNTLEIGFYWAGKGTLVVPEKGYYGPLISAISVTPNFVPENFDQPSEKISTAIIVIITVGSLFLFLVLVVLWMKCCPRSNSPVDNELRSLEQRKLFFSLNQIKEATRNFDPTNKIGEGGFGPVYKGELPDGRVVAVKQLSSKSRQGNREFMNEITMISVLQHPNLVKLHGCCTEGKQLMLIYEYLENNSLARALFGPDEGQIKLNWQTRFNICIGIARGLAFLHQESRFKIVHRDIKATNVLLDKDLNAKISDFGLAKLDGGENSHIITRIAGTVGYMAPEYATRGYLTDKADVYSFAIVMLELVTGQSNATNLPREEVAVLLDLAYAFEEEGRLLELVDPSLGSDFSKEEALTMLNLVLLCTSPSPTLRPTMSEVVQVLEGKAVVVESASVNGSSLRRDQDSMTLVESVSGYQSSWIDSSVTITGKEEDIVSPARHTSEVSSTGRSEA